jgi:hypothetical protein
MGSRYLPKTDTLSITAINDSAAYVWGVANLLSEEKNLQRMKAEGLGVYKMVKGFTVTDSTGKDIKPNLRSAYVQRMNKFIERQREEIWMSTIEKE